MNLSHFYIGIAMLSAGALTACGNILEEPSMAKATTGELSIELTTDATLEINTKATETESVENIITHKGTFSISMTPQTGTTVPTGTILPNKEGTHKGIPVGSYNIKAFNNRTMTKDFEWNNPVLESTVETVTVKPGSQNKTLTCTLQNSIIAVDAAAWTSLLSDVTVSAFQVVNMATVPTKGTTITGGTSLLASGSTTTLNSSMLYAKKDLQNVKIVLDGTLKSGSQQTFRASAPIRPNENNNVIGSKNKYNVSFSLDKSKGQLVLEIKVDNTVTPVPIVIPIIPDEATTAG